MPELCELTPFSLFAALYLGLTETEGYAEASSDQVRRRFALEPDAFQAYMEAQRLRDADLRQASFDVESARYDIKVVPPGVRRLEIARSLFEDFLSDRSDE